MVFTLDIKRKLIDLIASQPRSIQELALELQKNWRTIDGYVSKLKEEGLVSVKEFKRGAKTAFKIVYMQPEKNFYESRVQTKILKQIESGKRSKDFSPLDILQYIPEEKTRAYFNPITKSYENVNVDLAAFLSKAKKSLLMFSGDMDWIDLRPKGGKSMLEILEELAQDKVIIKVIARIDMSTKARVQKLLEINYRLGYDAIEIHHEETPLRCFMVDGEIVRLKEPVFTHDDGIKKLGTNIYEITDEPWTSWLEKVFWRIFRSSITAQKRLAVLDRIEELTH